MELADTSNITSAFKSAFSFPRTSIGSAQAAHAQDAEEDSTQQQSFMSTGSMDLADEGDVTSAFALNTHLFGSSTHALQARRRSSVAFATDTSEAQTQTQAQAQKEYAVPLGQEGIDEEAIARQREERIRRGSIAFFSSTAKQARPSISLPSEQEQEQASSSSAINGLFAVHHSPELGNGAEQQQNEGEEEEGEMDMSVVQDARRISNVFAVAFSAGASVNEEEEEAVQDGNVKGLYPSLESLKAADREGTNTPGAAALAFLDDEEEEEEEVLQVERQEIDDEVHEEEDQDLVTPPSMSAVTHTGVAVIPPKTFESLETPSSTLATAQTGEYFPPVTAAPEAVFQPRNTRLSVVPERFEEEEEEEDTTQDLGPSSQQSAQQESSQTQQVMRRLSIAHPSASAAASPARSLVSKSPRRQSTTLSIKAGRSPSPKKPSSTAAVAASRRQSLAALPSTSTSPTRSTLSTTANHNDLFKSAPPSSAFTALTSITPSRLPIPISTASKATSSPAKLAAKASQSPSKHAESGLTPAMSRLSSWTTSQQANTAASSPAPPSAARRLSFKTPSAHHQHQTEALAPTSEPIFDEAAPLDTDSSDFRKLSLDEFLSLTGVQFMDDMGPSTAMNNRRKSMMSASTRFNPAKEEEENKGPRGFDTTLADQAIASAAILPVMDMYRMVSKYA